MCGTSTERNGVSKFMDSHTKTEIVNTIIEDIDQELLDEEIMHLVLDKRFYPASLQFKPCSSL